MRYTAQTLFEHLAMESKIMFYRYLLFGLIIFSLPLTASILPHKNHHPAFNMLPLEALAQLSAQIAAEIPLSDADIELGIDELHYHETHPADWATLVGAASFNVSSLKAQNPERPVPPGAYINYKVTVDKQQYYMSVVEVFADKDNQFLYVKAKLVDHNSHARFVVSNQSGHIAAQLSVDGASYRILSQQTDASQQLIYKLHPADSQRSQWSNTRLLSMADTGPIYRLKWELLRTELLLEMAPTYYFHHASKSLLTSILTGHDLGYLDTSKIKKGAVSAEIAQYLSQLKLLTQSAHDSLFFVTKVKRNAGRVTGINFMQVVEGAIFEYASGISIRRDGQVGDLSLYTINTASGLHRPPRYAHQQVLDMAMERLKAYVSADELPLYIKPALPPYMEYFYRGEDQSIDALWLVTVFGQKSTDEDSYLVVIIDRTGEVVLTRGKSEAY